MHRTFKHRITISAACGIILLLCCALYFFWQKQPIPGAVFALGLVIAADAAINTEYTFYDRELVIRNGRLWRKKVIPYSEVTACKPMSTFFGLVRFLVIVYGKRIETVQPQNEMAFVDVLRKAIEIEKDREDNSNE